MRIGVLGASGRIGTQVIDLVLSSPGLELAAAWVSPGSRQFGQPVAGGSLEYRAPESAINCHCDVVIDFSTPEASLSFLDSLETKPVPVVIGTTGFSPRQREALETHATRRAMLVSSNFASGFEAFRLAALGYMARMPAAAPSISETYHARRAEEATTTSRQLATQLRDARSTAMGVPAPDAPVVVHRRGAEAGVNEIHFEMGSAEVVMTYRVHTLAAYAHGAIAAAAWLISETRAPGCYALTDSLTTIKEGRTA